MRLNLEFEVTWEVKWSCTLKTCNEPVLSVNKIVEKIRINILGDNEIDFFSIIRSHIDNSFMVFRTSHNENFAFPEPSNGSIER